MKLSIVLKTSLQQMVVAESIELVIDGWMIRLEKHTEKANE